MKLTSGQKLTYDAEGTDEQCRCPHVPPKSGVTWGHGYDCWLKSSSKILGDLLSVGIDREMAYIFSQCSGLRGRLARVWLRDSGLDQEVMTPSQQVALFLISYREMENSARLLYSKPSCRTGYGWILTWDSLLQPIRDIIVDLRFRGDWIPSSRKFLADAIRSNSVQVFAEAMDTFSFWRLRMGVPKDRHKRRIQFLKEGHSE